MDPLQAASAILLPPNIVPWAARTWFSALFMLLVSVCGLHGQTNASGNSGAGSNQSQGAHSNQPNLEYAVKFVCGKAERRQSLTDPQTNLTYYVVDATNPAADSGEKVCNAVGKSCQDPSSFTDNSTSLCQQLHPTATVDPNSVDGSNQGFYCDGQPQVDPSCVNSLNSCRICKGCNPNVKCHDSIAPKFREIYVQCFNGQPGAPDRLGEMVAPGEYFTAINVHNPSGTTAHFKKKVALALSEERPGPISQFFDVELQPDQALEIDCPDILRHARLTGSAKGFVVLQSAQELDVVAVYTAGHDLVETLQVDRIPVRAKPMVVKNNDTDCPANTRTSHDAVGNLGCCCNMPKSYPPGGPSTWWPDCAAPLECLSTPTGPGAYSVCSISGSLSAAELASTQPRGCRQ